MKRLLIYMVCVWLLSGCSPDGSPLSLSSGAIRFVSGISVEETKADGPVSGTTLPQGSRISLCSDIMNNLTGTIGAEGSIDYNPVKYYETGKEYTFYACYPYTTALNYTDTGQAPSLPVSLATHADMQEDYMWAALPKVTAVSGGTPAQKFTFRHALSRIRLRIWNGSAGSVPLNGISLTAPGTGTLSLADGNWTGVNETQSEDFTLFTLFHPAEAVALPEEAFYEIPASMLQLPVGEEVMKSQMFSIVIDGKSYEIHPATPSGGWQSGVSYLYTVWYAAEGITFKGTVEPWNAVDGGDAPTEE